MEKKLMELIELFIVLVAVSEKVCSSNIIINENKRNGFAELGEAAIRILTTCSATKTKTIAVDGEFPGDFIERPSTVQSYSLVMLNGIRRAENRIRRRWDINWKRSHKVDVFVTIAANPEQFRRSLKVLQRSLYDNPMALTLVIVWSPVKEYADCDGGSRTAEYFNVSNSENQLNTVLICQDRTKGVMMHSYNPFTDKAPEPWQQIPFRDTAMGYNFSYFVRQYRERGDNCKNLDYDKTHDLGSSEIKMVHYLTPTDPVGNSSEPFQSSIKEVTIELEMWSTYIYNFIAQVNGSRKHVWKRVGVGESMDKNDDELLMTPIVFTYISPRHVEFTTYPHGESCNYLISQFRGHKSQLQKIIDVIDVYTWIGLCIVYSITLMFLKFFFRQPLIAGILNEIRLICNCGVIASSPKPSSQIYMGCLLFVVVTMQGIFMGNLAALLTHDFPVRQINSKQDLIDFNYKVYVHPTDQILFNDPVFEGRIISRRNNEACIPQVQSDPVSACLEWGPYSRVRALQLKMHVSTRCISVDSKVHYIPFRWPLKERLNSVLMWSLATDIMLSLKAIVAKKRLLEEESQEVVLEPRVMVFGHVHFAFNILGIGLICALVCFIMELIVHRYRSGVTTTRVIVLNRSGNVSI